MLFRHVAASGGCCIALLLTPTLLLSADERVAGVVKGAPLPQALTLVPIDNDGKTDSSRTTIDLPIAKTGEFQGALSPGKYKVLLYPPPPCSAITDFQMTRGKDAFSLLLDPAAKPNYPGQTTNTYTLGGSLGFNLGIVHGDVNASMQTQNQNSVNNSVTTTAQPPPAPAPTPNSYGMIDLSGRFANVNGTIYDKTTGQAFSNPQAFFQVAGVSSFNNLKLDTNYRPLTLSSSPQQFAAPTNLPSTSAPGMVDLSGQFANVNGTIYNKMTGQAYSTPQAFFQASGVNSFNNVRFDTAWRPGMQSFNPQTSTFNPQVAGMQPNNINVAGSTPPTTIVVPPSPPSNTTTQNTNTTGGGSRMDQRVCSEYAPLVIRR